MCRRHRLEARLVSGSGGFRCALAAGLGAELPLGQEREWDEDAGAGVVVDDPAARILARHPSGRPAVVAVDHGDWTAVHMAAWSIPAATINRLVQGQNRKKPQFSRHGGRQRPAVRHGLPVSPDVSVRRRATRRQPANSGSSADVQSRVSASARACCPIAAR